MICKNPLSMKFWRFRPPHCGCACALIYCAVLMLSVRSARADQVEMQNGDRYAGNVLSLNTNTVVLQSDVLGTVNLPRSKVALITLGSITTVNRAALPSLAKTQLTARSPAPTNSPADLSHELRQLGTNNNLIQQVQAQFLSDAGPEANKKFNELVSGLVSGKMSVNDIRREAKSAADQVRALKKDLGDDTGIIDSYLAILDSFLQDKAWTSGALTNAATLPPKGKSGPARDED